MELLRKRPIAILIMIVVILLSILIGGRRSLLAERNRIIDYFYTASDSDEYAIQNDLEYISATANNFKTVALRYLQADDPYIVQLSEARASLDDAMSIPEKHDAAAELFAVVNALYHYLDPSAFDIDFAHRDLRTSLYDDISSAMQRISENEYNNYAREFNEMLAHGFTALIAGTTNVDLIPIYG